jgi:hypothetical protein
MTSKAPPISDLCLADSAAPRGAKQYHPYIYLRFMLLVLLSLCASGGGGSRWPVTWPSRIGCESGGSRGGGGRCSWWVPYLVVMVVGDVAGGPLVFARRRAVVFTDVAAPSGLDGRDGASRVGMREGGGGQ